MNSISNDHQILPQASDFYAQSFSGRSLEATQIAASSQEQKDITIYTDEGDKVTLSFESDNKVYYSKYQGYSRQIQTLERQNAAAFQMQSVAVKQETIEIDSQRAFTIAVEGDLSDQELEDIKTALQKIDALMTDILYENDFSEVAATISQLGELDSLAGIEADYQFAKEVAVQRTELHEKSQTASNESPVHAHHRRARHRMMPGNRFVNDLIRIVKDSGIKPRMFTGPLKALFRGFSERLPDNDDHGKPPFHWARHVRDNAINQ